MKNKLKLLSVLLIANLQPVWAKDVFDEPEEVEADPEVENNPALQNFLQPDETAESRKPKKKWERFKSLEEQGINYIPNSTDYQKVEDTSIPSDYSSDPFANRLDYIEENLGKKPTEYQQ